MWFVTETSCGSPEDTSQPHAPLPSSTSSVSAPSGSSKPSEIANLPSGWNYLHRCASIRCFTYRSWNHTRGTPSLGHTQPPPTPLEIEDDVEWKVQEVLDSRIQCGKMEYLVHRQGYGPHERTWEPPENLLNAVEAVTEFHARYPNRPASKDLPLAYSAWPSADSVGPSDVDTERAPSRRGRYCHERSSSSYVN